MSATLAENIAALIVSILVLGYLFLALIFPERF